MLVRALFSALAIVPIWLYGGTFSMMPKIESMQQVNQLFPNTVADIQTRTEKTITQARTSLHNLYAIALDKRTFDNTIRALDTITGEFSVFATICSVLELVHPEQIIREAAHQASIQLQNFYIDHVSQNTDLYKAFTNCMAQLDTTKLDAEEAYTVHEMSTEFKRSGLHLDASLQDKLKVLKKELAIHELNFEKNIAIDNRTIAVARERLTGLSDDFILNTPKDAQGLCVIGVDSPTYIYVMQNCTDTETRKMLWTAYLNRAYPANHDELSKIIMLRDQIAQILGFNSFAQYDIANQMAKSPEAVTKFLDNLITRCQRKVNVEVEKFKHDLPPSVKLTSDNKFKPWDLLFIRDYFKKKNYQIDEVAISEYFPLDSTLPALLRIYESFFSISFKPVEHHNLWHPDVQVLAVYKQEQFIGYILLDIFPRQNKYTHACEITIVPTFKHTQLYPALIAVIANFPRSVGEKPALLLRQDVITFFHEFGHAIHAILGATKLIGNSGAQVKRDFVEMPSQMLEEWMWQPEILKQISCHYITKEPLPDALINKIIALKNYNTGEHIQRQLYLSFLSLNYYTEGALKDVYQVSKNLFEKIITHVEFQPEDHLYASFGHLTNYASKYYGYLWSKVFALDLFAQIKAAKFSKQIGDRYIATIISKGGSNDPDKLLHDFLQREPNSEAFFSDLGI
jgi:thimet oligopeptidase